ncbi:unnamed protein product [Macrosiphum euphorbiae]|uniref:Uncharacterized protein n=1 Tax=Macrosiphum euphorbiae TaxID=13131 RepID=A0AAV0XNN8_9HEMI|nr:unnamed protein product [Macrosiphum euphorbiae]
MHAKITLLLPSTSCTHPLKNGVSNHPNRLSCSFSNNVAKSDSEFGSLGIALLHLNRIIDSAVDHGYNPAAITCLY